MSLLKNSPSPNVGVWFSTKASTRLPEHEHEVCELNLVTSGHITYEVQAGAGARESDTISRGECLIIPAGVKHHLTYASADSALWVLETKGEHALSFTAGRNLGFGHVVRPSATWFRAVGRACRRLWLRPLKESHEKAVLALWKLMQRPTFGDDPSELTDCPHDAVLKAREICESLGAHDVAIDDLAKQAGISPSRLSHLFQDQVGITPLQYRNFCRVQEFIRRWDGKETNLISAALAAGFGSYPQFHRTFRQVCDVSPREHLSWLKSCSIDPSMQLGA